MLSSGLLSGHAAGMAADKLVIGASGFLGSHVTRELVERGDIVDDQALRTAMAGCDVVYYCVVDTWAYLREPAPLYRTNVDGLRHCVSPTPTVRGTGSSPRTDRSRSRGRVGERYIISERFLPYRELCETAARGGRTGTPLGRPQTGDESRRCPGQPRRHAHS